jgi:hypothetical protein
MQRRFFGIEIAAHAHLTPIFRVYDHAMPEQRRFRTPWVVEDLAGCFVVKARGGQELAYIYYEDDPRRRSIVKLLSRDVRAK